MSDENNKAKIDAIVAQFHRVDENDEGLLALQLTANILDIIGASRVDDTAWDMVDTILTGLRANGGTRAENTDAVLAYAILNGWEMVQEFDLELEQ